MTRGPDGARSPAYLLDQSAPGDLLPLQGTARRTGGDQLLNGTPAHRDCVRVHLLQRDPAFHEGGEMEEPPEEMGDPLDGVSPRDDDEGDFG